MTPATTISRELAEATFLAIRMALGHRDASGLAIPQGAFPKRSARRGIAVDVDGRE